MFIHRSWHLPPSGWNDPICTSRCWIVWNGSSNSLSMEMEEEAVARRTMVIRGFPQRAHNRCSNSWFPLTMALRMTSRISSMACTSRQWATGPSIVDLPTFCRHSVFRMCPSGILLSSWPVWIRNSLSDWFPTSASDTRGHDVIVEDPRLWWPPSTSLMQCSSGWCPVSWSIAWNLRWVSLFIHDSLPTTV